MPSLCCGLYGLRPTTRRVPYAGASNVFVGFEGIESTVGPMARSISSLEVFMKAVIGARPWLLDPKVLPLPWQPQNSDKRLHVAFCIDNGMAHSHPPVRRAILDTVAALRAAGHEGSLHTRIHEPLHDTDSSLQSRRCRLSTLRRRQGWWASWRAPTVVQTCVPFLKTRTR